MSIGGTLKKVASGIGYEFSTGETRISIDEIPNYSKDQIKVYEITGFELIKYLGVPHFDKLKRIGTDGISLRIWNAPDVDLHRPLNRNFPQHLDVMKVGSEKEAIQKVKDNKELIDALYYMEINEADLQVIGAHAVA